MGLWYRPIGKRTPLPYLLFKFFIVSISSFFTILSTTQWEQALTYRHRHETWDNAQSIGFFLFSFLASFAGRKRTLREKGLFLFSPALLKELESSSRHAFSFCCCSTFDSFSHPFCSLRPLRTHRLTKGKAIRVLLADLEKFAVANGPSGA